MAPSHENVIYQLLLMNTTEDFIFILWVYIFEVLKYNGKLSHGNKAITTKQITRNGRDPRQLEVFLVTSLWSDTTSI